MQAALTTVRVRPLKPYEPGRFLQQRQVNHRQWWPNRQLELNLTLPNKPLTTGASGLSVGNLPESPRQLVGLLTALLEVKEGLRPAAQLQNHVHPRLYRLISHPLPGARRRFTLTSIHICHPDHTVIEACGTAQTGSQVFAVAARLERAGDTWRCTEFALLLPQGKQQ